MNVDASSGFVKEKKKKWCQHAWMSINRAFPDGPRPGPSGREGVVGRDAFRATVSGGMGVSIPAPIPTRATAWTVPPPSVTKTEPDSVIGVITGLAGCGDAARSNARLSEGADLAPSPARMLGSTRGIVGPRPALGRDGRGAWTAQVAPGGGGRQA